MEISASIGGSPEDAVVLSLALSPRSWAWLRGDTVVAIFGVGGDPRRPGVGVPWLLASDEVEDHKVFFVRQSRRFVEEMLAAYPYLENHVDCRHTASIQWLSWCGFALAEVLPFHGIQRMPFIRFCKAR